MKFKKIKNKNSWPYSTGAVDEGVHQGRQRSLSTEPLDNDCEMPLDDCSCAAGTVNERIHQARQQSKSTEAPSHNNISFCSLINVTAYF